MVSFSIKDLIYKQLNPAAKQLGMKLIVFDAQTYKSYSYDLEKKIERFGIDEKHLDELQDAIDNYGFVAVLKSKKYYGGPEIAPHFSKYGMVADDIHYMASKNAKHYPVWGDFDAIIPAEKRVFLYWFKVAMYDGNERMYLETELLGERKMSRQELDNFYSALKKGKVEFDFIKKDGTKRHAVGTLDPRLMPSLHGMKQMYADQGEDYDQLVAKLEQRKDYMPYFWDLEKGGYRQFHVSRFEGADAKLS